MEEPADYKEWSHEKLIERVTQLEQELKKKNLRSQNRHGCMGFF
jgi:hypothetical protein